MTSDQARSREQIRAADEARWQELLVWKKAHPKELRRPYRYSRDAQPAVPSNPPNDPQWRDPAEGYDPDLDDAGERSAERERTMTGFRDE